MMRWINLMLAVILGGGLLTACSPTISTWQEQYDLGVRYLSEDNYEEAIIAFTAAIEIDPKQAPAYMGRGDAYIGLGETEENLIAAQADYEKAIELDEALVEAYLGLADVYILQGEYDKAIELLQAGLVATQNNESIVVMLADLEAISDTNDTKGLDKAISKPDVFEFAEFFQEAIFSIPTIGGDSLSNITFSAVAEYYKANRYIEDEKHNCHFASTDISSANITAVANIAEYFESNILSIDYYLHSYPPYQIEDETNIQPEYLGICLGDSWETVLRKMGITELGRQYLKEVVIEGVLIIIQPNRVQVDKEFWRDGRSEISITWSEEDKYYDINMVFEDISSKEIVLTSFQISKDEIT